MMSLLHIRMSGDSCVVCMEDINLSQKRVLGCKHTFHHACLLPIDKHNGARSCPLCRASFTLPSLTYISNGVKRMHELKAGEVIYTDERYIYVGSTRIHRKNAEEYEEGVAIEDDTPSPEERRPLVTFPTIRKKY